MHGKSIIKPSRIGRYLVALTSMLSVTLGITAAAHGQLRVVTYNTTGAINTDLQNVLTAIAEEQINGVAKPIDVLLLQEQDSPGSDTQGYVNWLNSVYGPGTYARGTLSGLPTLSQIRQTVVYNTQTVGLIAEQRFGNTVGETGQEGTTMRYQLRPRHLVPRH